MFAGLEFIIEVKVYNWFRYKPWVKWGVPDKCSWGSTKGFT